jgi:hypothetical protein
MTSGYFVQKEQLLDALAAAGSGSGTNFVPGQTIHFLVKFLTFLFQSPKTFSHVFDLHNSSKRH